MIGFEGPTREAKIAALEAVRNALSEALEVWEFWAARLEREPHDRDVRIGYFAAQCQLKDAEARAQEWHV